MKQISFEQLAFEYAKLFVSVSSAEELEEKYRVGLSLIEACGWDVETFESELLNRIDGDWK